MIVFLLNINNRYIKFDLKSIELSFEFSIYNISGISFERAQFVISRLGTFMLIHNGFKFTRDSSSLKYSNGMKTRWRCAYKKNNKFLCTAKASTYKLPDGGEKVEYHGVHYHEPQI